MRILVTRTDRLGDVILATPVLKKIRETNPTAEIFFMVQRAWMPILAFGEAVRLIPYDPEMSESAMVSILRPFHFDVAYVLKDDKKVSHAVKEAGILIRIGVYSTLRSFFLFNEGKLQRRSQCRMHESEYNLDLVLPQEPAKDVYGLPQAWISTLDSARSRAAVFLQKYKLSPRGFIVIHPGSSGSSRYVKVEKLQYLAQRLMQKGNRVVISGGPSEVQLLEDFQEKAKGVVVLGPSEGLELDGMAEVYRQAKAVVAHGTGPLHLAAALKVPVLAVFPPLFVLSEKRWGPLVTRRAVWTPSVQCPEKYKCRGESCRYFDCMDQFDVESAVQSVEALCT